MSCIFLKGEVHKFCVAYQGMMILSVEELKKYCETSHYHLCPIYQQYHKYGIKVPVNQHSSYKYFRNS